MIFGFLPQNLKTEAVAVAFSIAWPGGTVEPGPGDDQAGDWLATFRRGLYGCLTARADELFELADAVLCAGGPVRRWRGLSLAGELLVGARSAARQRQIFGSASLVGQTQQAAWRRNWADIRGRRRRLAVCRCGTRPAYVSSMVKIILRIGASS